MTPKPISTGRPEWKALKSIIDLGWSVTLSPETRAVTVTNGDESLSYTAPDWSSAVLEASDEVQKNYCRMFQVPVTLSARELQGFKGFGVIAQACQTLGLPISECRLTLDLSRVPDARAAINRAVAVLTVEPIKAIVTQRGTHFDRCTELVLEWRN